MTRNGSNRILEVLDFFRRTFPVVRREAILMAEAIKFLNFKRPEATVGDAALTTAPTSPINSRSRLIHQDNILEVMLLAPEGASTSIPVPEGAKAYLLGRNSHGSI